MSAIVGLLVIFGLCPLLGALPLIGILTYLSSGKSLDRLGTGNLSVAAAFYHGGTWSGLLAVGSEAFKGIAAVLLARHFFPGEPAWPLLALSTLVLGRYYLGRGAGTTNVVWGCLVAAPVTSFFTLLLGTLGFTLVRERRWARLGVLGLFVAVTVLRHGNDPALVVAALVLAGVLALVYQHLPDDLDLPEPHQSPSSQAMFKFFRGDRSLVSLERPLDPQRFGAKAATLSRLRTWGYPVPPGWVLAAGDDPEPLISFLEPSLSHPLVVRSSALGEDDISASSAGQYQTILQVVDRPGLEKAILTCFASYSDPVAERYRRDRGLQEASMALVIQPQINGVFSGVTFSRNPVTRQGSEVVVEALPGPASLIVSGRVTPESYRVTLPPVDFKDSWVLPESGGWQVDGRGDVPPHLIAQVAFLARHLEGRYHGVPQDLEWTYDGQSLWLLQARPVTTLMPIWTRRIAAEVIPGLVHPLTWSINHPLTSQAWGDLFRLVLGKKAAGLEFSRLAILHHGYGYFNASLLGEIFQRMGLPVESLDFLTRGGSLSRPSWQVTLRNLPGLLALAKREWSVGRDFARDLRTFFQPALAALHPLGDSSQADLIQRARTLIRLLERATYYSILVPLGVALRQALGLIPPGARGYAPELAALAQVQTLAQQVRLKFPQIQAEAVFTTLEKHPEGQELLTALAQIKTSFGYLSAAGTDITVPTWQEDSGPLEQMFIQSCGGQLPSQLPSQENPRLTLKGQVSELYSQLMAQLRWTYLALAQQWCDKGNLRVPEDIFFLERPEIESPDFSQFPAKIAQRREAHSQNAKLDVVPPLVYGQTPPELYSLSTRPTSRRYQGVGASPGRVEGRVKVLRNLTALPPLDRSLILVVPYTDAGWAPVLAQAGGLIAATGGCLSHGAIIAREYAIPAVMDIQEAMAIFEDGQLVRLDGERGVVEILALRL